MRAPKVRGKHMLTRKELENLLHDFETAIITRVIRANRTGTIDADYEEASAESDKMRERVLNRVFGEK